MMRDKKAIVTRHAGNPILTGEDFPNDIVTVFNSSVVKQRSDRYVMVCRVEDSALGRYLWVADSVDGVHFKPRPRPLSMPKGNPVFDEYCGETKSYWDPRITEIEDQYYITHAAHTRHECQLGLFKVDRDFEHLDWLGLILPPDNRNGVLFPERIGGRYWLLHRPNVAGRFDMWISCSPDLLHWGGHRRLVAKEELRWADAKVGGGAVPIRTPEGWLCIIHGVRIQCTDFVYSLGVMLLDLENPTRVVGLSKRAILDPKEPYELMGQALSVVFTTGAVAEPDGTLKIYYGAADTVQCLATAKLQDLIDSCKYEKSF